MIGSEAKAGLLGVVVGLCLGGPATADSLERELAALFLDHPQIRAAAKTLEAQRMEIGIARAGYFPTISSTSEGGHEVVDNPAERNQDDGQNGKPSSRTTYSQNITVAQNLFNGFETSALVRTARLNKEIARTSFENTRQNMAFEGINAYINVLRQKRLIDLAVENEATIQRQLNLEDERVQRGSGVAVDVLQAKSRLQISKERRVSFEGAMIDAISRYRQVYGHPPDVESMMGPVPPIELLPSTLEHAIEIAVTENPSLTSAGTTVEIARERQRTVRADLYPSVDMEGQFNYVSVRKVHE